VRDGEGVKGEMADIIGRSGLRAGEPGLWIVFGVLLYVYGGKADGIIHIEFGDSGVGPGLRE